MDVSSRFGVCEVTPCTWSLLHNRITFLWRKKKKEKEKRERGRGEREGRERESKLGSGSWMHMSGESVTIRETVSNYLFVCSISRWGW